MLFIIIMAFLIADGISAQDLTIAPEDLRLELRSDGGFHLFIRKKQGIASVMLTETTRDPALRAENYAYRAREWNPVNGDEIRILDGEPIPRESGIFSLIDSTPDADSEFGQAFHIYVPHILEYGYQNTRHGEVYVADGMYLNIRAFALPYGDYRGAFSENPFIVQISQQPSGDRPAGNYSPEAVESFTGISSGNISWSSGDKDIINNIENILKRGGGKTVDLVLCLDTTNSMKPHIDSVRQMLIPMLKNIINSFENFRIGMVLYKDYREEYLTRVIPFTKNFSTFQRNLNGIRVMGGGDIPEAVHEALYDAATKFTWEADEKLIILIGDAPPHPSPRGKITREMVEKEAGERGIRINAIILPN